MLYAIDIDKKRMASTAAAAERFGLSSEYEAKWN
jgi:hypothetical protein